MKKMIMFFLSNGMVYFMKRCKINGKKTALNYITQICFSPRRQKLVMAGVPLHFRIEFLHVRLNDLKIDNVVIKGREQALIWGLKIFDSKSVLKCKKLEQYINSVQRLTPTHF